MQKLCSRSNIVSKKSKRSALMDLDLQVRRPPPPHDFLYFLQFFYNFVFLSDARHVLLLLFLKNLCGSG